MEHSTGHLAIQKAGKIMTYAESESMALKRLKVALKRKDWQMFDYGLTKIVELLNSGTTISEIQEWYKILDIAKSEKIPDDLLQKLSKTIESVLTPTSTTHLATSASAETTINPVKYPSPKMASLAKARNPETSFVVYLDNLTTLDQITIVQKLRHNLNKMSLEPDVKLDLSLLSELSKLLKSLDKPYQELNGLETFLSSYPEPGVIITTSYDSEIIKILNRYNIDYSIDDIKKATTDHSWKIYPLGGLTSIYWCPTCNTRTFYQNSSYTVVSICKKCSSAAYPDLYPIASNNPSANPKLWYLAYEALINSANWLLISPPNINEKQVISQLISEACNQAIIDNAYIVSNKSEIGTWWRNRLEETISNCNVAPVCFNVEILLNNYIKLPEATIKQ